jgi:hypothetical protein
MTSFNYVLIFLSQNIVALGVMLQYIRLFILSGERTQCSS